jgi:hypothetical protein
MVRVDKLVAKTAKAVVRRGGLPERRVRFQSFCSSLSLSNFNLHRHFAARLVCLAGRGDNDGGDGDNG